MHFGHCDASLKQVSVTVRGKAVPSVSRRKSKAKMRTRSSCSDKSWTDSQPLLRSGGLIPRCSWDRSKSANKQRERYLGLMRVDKVTRWPNNVPQCQDLGKALARRTEANDHMHRRFSTPN